MISFAARVGLVSGILTLACASAGADPVTSGLALWLDASNGLAVDGSTWTDLSGNGHDATALTGQAPTVIPDALNGLPVAQFSAGQVLSVAGQVLTSQQFTVIALVTDNRDPADGSFREIFSNWDGSNSTTSVFLGTTNSDPLRARFTDDIGGATDAGAPQEGRGAIPDPTDPFILGGISDTADSQVLLGDNVIYDAGAPISTRDLTTGYFIGDQGSSESELWDGDIAELLVYNTALSADDYAADIAYLDAKWFGASQPAVPEPGTLALMAMGVAGLGFIRRRRQ